MVLSDLNILCIGQKMQTIAPTQGINIEANDRNTIKYSPIYVDSWQVLQRITGMWYSIEPAARDGKPWNPDTEFFDLSVEKPRRLMVVSNDRSNDIVGRLIDYYLKASPIKTIAVLLRLQDDGDDVFHGIISKQMFMRKFANGEIMYNVAYLIRDDEESGMTIHELYEKIAVMAEAAQIDELSMERLENSTGVDKHIECSANAVDQAALMKLQVLLHGIPTHEAKIWEYILERIDPTCLSDSLLTYFYEKHIALNSLGHMDLPDKWLNRFGKYVDEALMTLGKRISKDKSYSTPFFAEFLFKHKNREALLLMLLQPYCRPAQQAKRSVLFHVCSGSAFNTVRSACTSIMEMERISLTSDATEIGRVYANCTDPAVLLGIAQNMFAPLPILEALSKVSQIKNGAAIRSAAQDTVQARRKLLL